jgi:TRAP-type uncharacterized transport system fused permease subunit
MVTPQASNGDVARLRRILRRSLITIIALAFALFHMYSSGVRPLPGVQQRTTHLAFALMLIFLMFPFRSKSDESQEEKVADESRHTEPAR